MNKLLILFLCDTSSNVDGVNGTTNWTKFEGIFKSRHDESGDFWDQYIGDPSLTLLNNGSIILLYRGWKKGKEHESKIGIASTTDWRKEPFHRIGKDGILLQSKYANQSYGEPTLHVKHFFGFNLNMLSLSLQVLSTKAPRQVSRSADNYRD